MGRLTSWSSQASKSRTLSTPHRLLLKAWTSVCSNWQVKRTRACRPLCSTPSNCWTRTTAIWRPTPTQLWAIRLRPTPTWPRSWVRTTNPIKELQTITTLSRTAQQIKSATSWVITSSRACPKMGQPLSYPNSKKRISRVRSNSSWATWASSTAHQTRPSKIWLPFKKLQACSNSKKHRKASHNSHFSSKGSRQPWRAYSRPNSSRLSDRFQAFKLTLNKINNKIKVLTSNPLWAERTQWV